MDGSYEYDEEVTDLFMQVEGIREKAEKDKKSTMKPARNATGSDSYKHYKVKETTTAKKGE